MDGTILILGEPWTIKEGTEKDFPALEGLAGYTDTSVRTIVIHAGLGNDGDPMSKDGEEYKKATVRHEVIHAFLYESGLEGDSGESEHWAMNEEMIDWLALQFPKMLKVFNQLNVL